MALTIINRTKRIIQIKDQMMSVDRRKVRRVVTLNLNFHVPNTSVHKKAAVCLSKFPNQFASQATDWRTVQSPLLSHLSLQHFLSTFLSVPQTDVTVIM